jgi:hypothetical protein
MNTKEIDERLMYFVAKTAEYMNESLRINRTINQQQLEKDLDDACCFKEELNALKNKKNKFTSLEKEYLSRHLETMRLTIKVIKLCGPKK